MNCPDTERLLSVALGEGADPETEAHLRECSACARLVSMFREMRSAYDREVVPSDDDVKARVDMVMRELARQPRHASPTAWDLAATGGLAIVTTWLTIVLAGPLGGGGLAGPVLLSLLVGLAAVIYEGRSVEAA